METTQQEHKTVKRNLMVDITEEDRVKYTHELAKISADLDKTEEQLACAESEWKELKKSATEEANVLQAQITTIHRVLQHKKHEREVECVEIRNYDGNAIEWWIGDKMIDHKPMTAEERQSEMNLADPDDSGQNVGAPDNVEYIHDPNQPPAEEEGSAGDEI